MTYNDILYQFSINPFQLISPNLMPPRLFWDLISEENSWINKLRERNDIFIEGNRGCGKSTLLFFFKVDYLIEKFKNLHTNHGIVNLNVGMHSYKCGFSAGFRLGRAALAVVANPASGGHHGVVHHILR